MLSRVPDFVVIILQIGCVSALSWTNNFTHLSSCEDKNVELRWDYKIEPGEYVKAKTWFTGVNTTAKRIAYWKDTDGVTIEPDYTNRIEMIGNDGFIMKYVKASDEGPYTMIASMPHSSERDPRKTLYLTIYISPLKDEGCCKPEIDVKGDKLVAFLPSYQGCGKPSPSLTWVEHKNKTVTNGSLYLGETNREGIYKVCVTGPVIDKCFPGDKKILCRTHEEIRNASSVHYIQEEAVVHPHTIAIIVSTCVGLALIVIITVVCFVWKRKRGPLMKAKRKTGKKSEDVAKLIDHFADLKSLTTELIEFYKTVLHTSHSSSNIQYEMEIIEGDHPQSDKFNTSLYEDILCQDKKPINRVLLQGNAGCGKKTWCSSFIRTWCEAHRETVSPNKNIKFMLKFKLLFNVSLRDVTDEKDINELLKRQRIPNFNSLQGDIYKHLKNNSDVIFLIQGLDEYTGNADVVKELLDNTRLNTALIVFTSRPMTRNSFQNNFQMDWPFSRTVTIKGLDKKDLMERAKELLIESEYPIQSLDKLSPLVKERGLGDFMKEPIFFPFLINMWQKSGTVPSCKAEFLLNVLEHLIKKQRKYFLRQYRDKTYYKFDFNANSMLLGKVFICHYGLILRSLGKIAMELRDNKESIFDSRKFEEENFGNFCVSVDLICRCNSPVSANDDNEEESDKHKEEKFSFRHRSMELFLAALYVISLPTSEQQKMSAMWSGTHGENLVETRNPENMHDSLDELREYVTYLSS